MSWVQGNSTMNQTQHPDVETLVAYTESPNDPQHLHTALHMAKCTQCRESVNSIKLVLDNMENLTSSSNDDSGESNVSDEKINSLISGKLDQDSQDQIRELMKIDSYLTKRVLYHVSNSSLEKEGEPSVVDTTLPDFDKLQQGGTESVGGQLKKWFTDSVSARVGTPIAAAAAAAFLTFSVFTSNPNDNGLQILAYQDDPTISIFETAPTPGMGFFKATEANKQSFSGVSVKTLKDDKLLLSWPVVNGATKYEITLKQFSKGKVLEVLSESSEVNSIEVAKRLNPGSRYEWVLKGKTKQGGEFKAFGGFVVN